MTFPLLAIGVQARHATTHRTEYFCFDCRPESTRYVYATDPDAEAARCTECDRWLRKALGGPNNPNPVPNAPHTLAMTGGEQSG